jgi:transcriptional regulator with XRE-family HTH domain
MVSQGDKEMASMLPAIRDIIGVQVTGIGHKVGCPSGYMSYACRGVRPLPRKYQGQFIKQLHYCSERLKAVPLSAYEMQRVIDDCCISVQDVARKLGVSNTTLWSRLKRGSTRPEKLQDVQIILHGMGRDLEKALKQVEDARSTGKVKRAKVTSSSASV